MTQSTFQQRQHTQYAQHYHPVPSGVFVVFGFKTEVIWCVEIIRGPLNSVRLEIICLKLCSLIGVEPCFIVV